MSERRARRSRLLSATSRLTREGRGRRRYNCAKQDDWGDRAAAAVGLLAAHEASCGRGDSAPLRIADLGAGNERLRPLLQTQLTGRVDYRAYDLHPQLPSTVRLDAGSEMPPGDFDVAICLGLLEYLPSVPRLAEGLAETTALVLVSYVTSDSPVAMAYEQRLEHGWENHLTATEVGAVFDEAGFRTLARAKAEGEITTLWLWENARMKGTR